eukprot:CAMPEP_0172625184 /NCGR_PEP_ID=MMETSP1068-20121228/142294_1 /TAXON_ID=35684 /ORGANISM="Pseudopedinella elastica, Strain CCMP716" /LENGTH=243 /DNA_ID=CAMNT_0013434403 /DNA_START=94 /DNA_END=822 /DNA_ORIENTATION=+
MGGGKHPLAFLGKKSWHTKNLKNVETVWIAEEKERAELKKQEDLKKQIAEERQLMELRQMQADAGVKKAHVEKLDWMYEGPMSGKVDDKEAEEYLLGKTYEPKAEKDAVNQQISRQSEQPGALWAQKTSANDQFSKMNEDPMLKIRQQELKAREQVVKNPLKMNRVRKEIESQLKAERDAKKEAKQKRKEAKKAKKREKKEKKESRKESKHRRSPSASSDSSKDDKSNSRGAEPRNGDGQHSG